MYDPYWSVIPAPIVVWWGAQGDPDPVRKALMAGLIAVWGVRQPFVEGAGCGAAGQGNGETPPLSDGFFG